MEVLNNIIYKTKIKYYNQLIVKIINQLLKLKLKQM